MSGAWLALVGLGFLCGSLPFGLWIGRAVAGLDVRRRGSGNLGATNVLRLLGVRWGLLVLVLDGFKGLLPVACGPALLGLGGLAEGSLAPLAAALAAVAGHLFSPLAGGQGGKGVATALGAHLALCWPAALLGIAAFALTVAVGRYVSLASQAMVTAIPVAGLWFGPPLARPALAATGLLLAVVIGWRHRANWRRLAQGREGRIGRRT